MIFYKEIQKQNLVKTTWLQFMRKINYFLHIHPFKLSRRLRSINIKILTPKPKGPTIVHSRYNQDIICLDPVNDQGVEKVLYLEGVYEAGTLSVLKKILSEGDIFFDVGANIGVMSLFASKIVGKNGEIYAFEPEPETFKILKENIRINKINNIQTYNFGLGNKNQQASIFTDPRSGRGSTSLLKKQKIKEFKEYKVGIKKIDDFIAQQKVKDIKIIKIDVEGWELPVLEGAKSLLKSQNAPIICIEYSALNSDNKRLGNLYQYILSLNNYLIYKLEYGKEVPSKLVQIERKEDLPRHDNLFCFLPTHLEDINKTTLLFR